MLRSLALLLTPLVTVGLVYAFGIGAVITCFVLALLTLILSTGKFQHESAKGHRRDFAYTTVAAGL
jgi:hypothetical protein